MDKGVNIDKNTKKNENSLITGDFNRCSSEEMEDIVVLIIFKFILEKEIEFKNIEN